VITFNAMTGTFSEVPFKLLFTTAVGLLAAIALTVLLAWHGIRRFLDVPRVPRPAGMYVALTTLWLGLVTSVSMLVATIVLMRDHRRVDAPTALGDVRCEAIGSDHARAELRTSLAAAPEQYDVPGGGCTVWVRQVELRPGLGVLGARVLSRIESVGPVRRPAANPQWMTPGSGGGLVDLVVRTTESVAVPVPADAQVHEVQVSALSGPTLAPGHI
jgi:hypothetical protein